MTATETVSDIAGAHAADRDTDHDQLQLVTFAIGEEEFGVNILLVQEINRMLQITQVPQSPPDVVGVINLRGRIIPVFDLRTRFGLPAAEQNNDNRIVVADVDGHTLGFIVDRVNEVLRIDSSIVEPAPAMASSIDGDYIEGVGKLEDRLLILLNLSRLFDVSQIQHLGGSAEPEAVAA